MSPFKTPFRYYLIRSNKLADAGEISGIVKIPHRYGLWHGRYLDGGDLFRITEPVYSTYEAFGITVYKWIIAAGNLKDSSIYVYAYNPEFYEVVNGRVEPKCIT